MTEMQKQIVIIKKRKKGGKKRQGLCEVASKSEAT